MLDIIIDGTAYGVYPTVVLLKSLDWSTALLVMALILTVDQLAHLTRCGFSSSIVSVGDSASKNGCSC